MVPDRSILRLQVDNVGRAVDALRVAVAISHINAVVVVVGTIVIVEDMVGLQVCTRPQARRQECLRPLAVVLSTLVEVRLVERL